MMPTLILKPKREKSLINRHPWIFSGAIARIDGQAAGGESVDIKAADGRWLAQAAFSPTSQIRARVWTFDRDETIDGHFFRRRVEAAMALRKPILESGDTTGCRIVCAESDGLPGLIVDRYDRWLVCQFLAAGSEFWKKAIVETLAELTPDCRGIYERSDVDVRGKEGLKQATGVLWGEAPPERIDILENGRRYRVDVLTGHKTGFYLDQRDNRSKVAASAKGRRVLNCFSYTGGFAVAALIGGARQVTNVDTSATVLALARENIALNGLDDARVDYIDQDVFTYLRSCHAASEKFDLIVLDPPKFVKSKSDLKRGARGYKDINRLAFELLGSGGILFTFSCSGLMPPDLFQKIVADAALDAGRPAVIQHVLHQAPDHPTALAFPEGSYLNGLVCRVTTSVP